MKRISNINIRSKFKKDSKQRIDLEIRNEQSCSVNVTKLHTFAYTWRSCNQIASERTNVKWLLDVKSYQKINCLKCWTLHNLYIHGTKVISLLAKSPILH